MLDGKTLLVLLFSETEYVRKWASDAKSAALYDMRIDLSNTDILMPHLILYGTNIGTVFQKMCGEGMTIMSP